MSGFRVGFAVGNKDMIQALKKYQTHTNLECLVRYKMRRRMHLIIMMNFRRTE